MTQISPRVLCSSFYRSTAQISFYPLKNISLCLLAINRVEREMSWVPALCSLIREPHPAFSLLPKEERLGSVKCTKPGDQRQLTNQGLSSAKQARNHTSNPATCSTERDFLVSFYYSSTVFPIFCGNKFL